jgi:2-keto-4-pentenoate hydratase
VTVMETDRARELAAELLAAEDAASAVVPLTDRHPQMTVDDAYAIQLAGRRLREARGARISGRKVGLTAVAMQQLLGVDSPDFGYLTEAMIHSDGAEIELGELVAPRVEAEIALRLGVRLGGAEVGFEEALAAVEAVAPALEIVDSRVADWRITLADTVADNASSGRAVLGEFSPRTQLDLAGVGMEIDVTFADGRTASATGTGAAVLGHPVHALVWLVHALAPYGEALDAGEVVIPGAMHAAITVDGPGEVVARFAGLGEVGATFVGGRR